MAVEETFTERARRKRRQDRKNWTLEDERQWITDHPNEKPLEGYDLSEPEQIDHDDDLIPDLGDDAYERSDEDDEIDAIVDRISIVEAYNRWSRKGNVGKINKREGHKVRCPNPLHPDKNPSAWINLDKDVWACGACEMGGDKFDIAAWYFGIDDYKGKRFPELRRRMAEDLGYTVTVSKMTGKTYVAKEEAAPPAKDEGAADAGITPPSHGPASSSDDSTHTDDDDDSTPIATVTSIDPDDYRDIFEIKDAIPTIPWRNILGGDTFLRNWMEETSKDSPAEEFYFWLGLQMLGLACGNDLPLANDPDPDVYGNLFLVLMGGSGTGKSRASSRAQNLIADSIGFDPTDAYGKGVATTHPGSGEALLQSFILRDESGIIDVEARKLIRFDEFADLVAISSRQGSSMSMWLQAVADGFLDLTHETRGAGVQYIHRDKYFGSALSTSQIRRIRDLMREEDVASGFLNRWIFIGGHQKPRPPRGGPRVDLERCGALLKGTKRWASERALAGSKMNLFEDDLATEIWEEFEHSVIDPTKTKKSEEEDELFNRMDLHLKKLVLLFAIDNREKHPSARSVEQAISLWNYMEQMYTLVGGKIGQSELDEMISKILVALERGKGEGLTTREITRRYPGSKKPKAEQLAKALRIMQELQLIEEGQRKTTAKGGRPSIIYKATAS